MDDDEAFLMTQIYTAERAIATNEFWAVANSNGNNKNDKNKNNDERLTAIFNFKDYSRKNSPSTSTIMTLAKVLQRCYPERLGVLIITYPPFWMKALYNMIWPMLSTATTEKIKLPSNERAVNDAFRDIVNDGDDNKLISMLSTGDISSSIDWIDYTKRPFYLQYE